MSKMIDANQQDVERLALEEEKDAQETMKMPHPKVVKERTPEYEPAFAKIEDSMLSKLELILGLPVEKSKRLPKQKRPLDATKEAERLEEHLAMGLVEPSLVPRVQRIISHVRERDRRLGTLTAEVNIFEEQAAEGGLQ